MVIDMYNDLIIIIVIIALPLFAQWKIKSTYNKYAKVLSNKRLSGREVAQKILSNNGISNVEIYRTSGSLTDHYDPKNKSVSLSESIYSGKSISSVSVAAHECGHAIQDKIGYSFMRFRSAMVPVVNITSSLSSILIMIGFFTEFLGLVTIGIILLSVGLLFQLITLPVEFDASRRAKDELYKLGIVDETERTGVKKVLNAAAFTYVAGFLASALQVARLMLMTRRRR